MRAGWRRNATEMMFSPSLIAILPPRFKHRGSQAQGAPVLELGPDLDPRGVLSKAAGNTHVHIDENVVKYFHKRKVLDRSKM